MKTLDQYFQEMADALAKQLGKPVEFYDQGRDAGYVLLVKNVQDTAEAQSIHVSLGLPINIVCWYSHTVTGSDLSIYHLPEVKSA